MESSNLTTYPEVAVILPSIWRSHKIEGLIHNIKNTSGIPVKIYGVYERDDISTGKAFIRSGVYLLSSSGGTAPKAFNVGYAGSVEPIIYMACDDLIFTEGWLTKAVDCMQRSGKSVIGTNSGHEPPSISGFLIKRRYIEENEGYLLFEGYDHLYADTEFQKIAEKRGEYLFCKESVVLHDHVAGRQDREDDTYWKVSRKALEDKALFDSRKSIWG